MTDIDTNVNSGDRDRNLNADQLATAAKDKTSQVANRVTDKVQSVASNLRERVGEGRLGDAADSLQQGIQRAGSYLRESDFKSVGNDLGNVVRQYPVQSTLIGVGIGILIGRALGGSTGAARV